MNYRLLATICALIAFGVAGRLVPHLPNATPLTALALVGGMYLGTRWAVIIPLLTLVVSDVIIGIYDWRIMASVYVSFALIGCLSVLLRTRRGVLPMFVSVTGASIMFFLITNAAVWIFSPWYEKSITGLLYAYELGLPFLRFMFAGDLLYAGALYAAFELVAYAARRSTLKVISLSPEASR